MSKNSELDELFTEWKEYHAKMNINPERFCPDGIINESKYLESHLKILFIMREVNSTEGFDLREMLKEGPKYQMWYTIARWSAGIIRNFPSYEEIDNYESMKNSLLSVATMNLKKTYGGSMVNLESINAYAHMDSKFLRKQIEIIEPEIMVACGTFSLLIWLLDLPVDSDDPISKVCITEKFKVVPWRHPGRVNNKETYEELKEKVRQYI